jgi:predicted nucleotidyltransferase
MKKCVFLSSERYSGAGAELNFDERFGPPNVAACKWILAEGTPPPMEFHVLMEKYLDADLKPDVEKLLDLKMNSPEISVGKRFDRVNDYLDHTIAELEQIVATMSDDKLYAWDELNDTFLKVIK